MTQLLRSQINPYRKIELKTVKTIERPAKRKIVHYNPMTKNWNGNDN